MKLNLRSEPVAVLLGGLAVVVNLILGALVAVDTIDWDLGQIAAVVAAIDGAALLVGAVLRAAVVSPATDQARTEAALDDAMGVGLID